VWQRMEPLIPPKKGKEGHPRTVNLRAYLRTAESWYTRDVLF
jgi:hypothetical protein